MVIDRQLSIKDPKQEERGRPNYIKRVLSYDFFREYTDGGISTLWNEYIIRSQWRYRISWVLGALFVYFIASSLFLGVLGAPPEPPVRGPYSYTITMIILILSGALFSFLFLYVFDATRLCHQFMVNVAEKRHYWPKESLLDFLDEEQPDRREEQKKLLSEWRTVLLVAKRTDAVGRLIFYPLIVGIVVFIARHSYFDNWNTTIPILVILMVGVLVTWICALIQRFDAEHLRNASISRLKEQKMAILYRKDLDDITRQIDHAIEDIKFIKQGAFAPFSQQPVFHSIILALSSIGGTYLIEFVSALNF
jgi:hypothetical protein